MRQDNRGVSLVEVMVVIAILAVMGGVGIWGLNVLTNKPAQQCAQKIVYSLERHRTTAMSKVEAEYRLVQDPSNGKVYIEEWVSNGAGLQQSSRTEIADSKTNVQFVVDFNNPDILALRHSLPLTLAFDRSSGSFKKVTVDGSEVYCTNIVITRGGRDFKVTLVPLTGKVYIE